MELSNVLNINDSFKLDILINFVLIKKKGVFEISKAYCNKGQ